MLIFNCTHVLYEENVLNPAYFNCMFFKNGNLWRWKERLKYKILKNNNVKQVFIRRDF